VEKSISIVSEIDLIKAERNKRMLLFGAVFFDDGSHASAWGPGMILIKQTGEAIAAGTATKIPTSRSAIIESLRVLFPAACGVK